MTSSFKSRLRTLYDRPSHWGERLGWEWLVYNPGVVMEFGMVARRNAPLFGAALMKCFREAHTVADVGCGTGYFAAFLAAHGKQVIGFEYSRLSRLWARRLGVDVRTLRLGDEDRPPRPETCDLAFSLEVGEHIPAVHAGRFVDFLCRSAPWVVLTCAPPGQTGNGHINCQPKAYWRALFAEREFITWAEKEEEMRACLAVQPRLSPFLRDNVMVFRARAVAR